MKKEIKRVFFSFYFILIAFFGGFFLHNKITVTEITKPPILNSVAQTDFGTIKVKQTKPKTEPLNNQTIVPVQNAKTSSISTLYIPNQKNTINQGLAVNKNNKNNSGQNYNLSSLTKSRQSRAS
ncbi:hypothetical protein COZ82_03075 [Candidatus Kaiserbacteria bacterium CG_4_8_14_3_um_filter_38_9]|uniref:Uncharacterized protein n=1 Tax=Candidatus Kaiserbacteria bacterium CG_4_8_14_3_um_filter_38_9 TaxID=1974599 RepID=A0A2M7INB0_9BACT|nr:MAG: hypothetical protein COZ82_03075 [Candidatus Kaiserbacteria bacterium CG_4_8_14_3_um_filter_38_9]